MSNLNFATLVSNAPRTTRVGGGGKSSDPTHAHFWRGKSTQTLTLPVSFLTERGYHSGLVTVDGDNLYVIMSTQTKGERGGQWMSFHQRPDTRHLVVPKGSAIGDRLASGNRDFTVTEVDDPVEGLDETCTVYTLTEC